MQLGTERKLPPVTALIYSASRQQTDGSNAGLSRGKIAMCSDVNWCKLSRAMKHNVMCHMCWHYKLSCQAHVVYVHLYSSYTCRHKNCPVFSSLSHWLTQAICLTTSQTASLYNCPGLFLPLMNTCLVFFQLTWICFSFCSKILCKSSFAQYLCDRHC